MKNSEERERRGLRRIVERGPAAAVCDIGCRRPRNEDAFYLSDDADILVVADGLGGLPAGDVASRVAVEAMATRLDAELAAGDSAEIPGRELLEAFAPAERRVCQEALRAGRRGMATALAVAWVAGTEVYCANVGDVRAYLLRGAEALLLSQDHTVAADRVAAGLIDPQALRGAPERNALTRVIGLGDAAAPALARHDVKRDDVLLVCSDGLWEPLLDGELAAVGRTALHEPRRAVVELADLAIRRGAPDNLTAVIRGIG